MGVYLPIDPKIDANGDLASVVALYPHSVGRARPIDLEAGQRFFASPGFTMSVMSSATLAALCYSDRVVGGRKSDSTVCVIDVGCFSESRNPAPRRNIVRTTRWGCGLRCVLTIGAMPEEYELSARSFDIVSMAAAAVRLDRAGVRYKMSGIGIGYDIFVALLDGIEPTGVLTVGVAERLSRTLLDENILYRNLMDLSGKAVNGKPVLSSLPLEVVLRDDDGRVGRSTVQSVAFGLRCLSDGLDVRSALRRGTIAGYDKRSIRRAYAMIRNPHDRIELQPPTATEMTIAQQWLELKMV